MMDSSIRTAPRMNQRTWLMGLLVFVALGLMACQPDGSFEMGEGEDHAARQALADTIRTSLRQDVLAPWYPRVVDTDRNRARAGLLERRRRGSLCPIGHWRSIAVRKEPQAGRSALCRGPERPTLGALPRRTRMVATITIAR